jgi:hypothetical protein
MSDGSSRGSPAGNVSGSEAERVGAAGVRDAGRSQPKSVGLGPSARSVPGLDVGARSRFVFADGSAVVSACRRGGVGTAESRGLGLSCWRLLPLRAPSWVACWVISQSNKAFQLTGRARAAVPTRGVYVALVIAFCWAGS